jgi:hypothetical protein
MREPVDVTGWSVAKNVGPAALPLAAVADDAPEFDEEAAPPPVPEAQAVSANVLMMILEIRMMSS